MKKAELKRILSAMIETLTDKQVLYDLEKDIFPYVINYRTKKMDKGDDDLTKEQANQLDEMIRQPDAVGAVTLKDVKKSFAKMHSKKKKKEKKRISKISKKKLRKKLHALIDRINSKYVLNVLLDDIMPDALNTRKYD